MQHCNTQNCPEDCKMAEWSEWEASVTCGSGIWTRHRDIATHAAHGGAACSTETTQTSDLDLGPCPIHCDVGAWAGWSDCTLTCGGGSKARSRDIETHAEHGGYQCPVTEEVVNCNTDTCPTDCQVSVWGSFSECSTTCGGGSKTRTRAVLKSESGTELVATHGGVPCPELENINSCNTEPCAIDCVQSEWTDPGDCSVTCGAGSETKTRTITTSPEHGGVACAASDSVSACNMGPCPIHCDVSAFGQFSECTKTCGTGSKTKTRTVTQHPAHGGYVCPDLAYVDDCEVNPCPEDCVMSEWEAYSDCTHTCGTGTQTRTRTIKDDVNYGGVACGSSQESQHCNTFNCPINCIISDWTDFGDCTLSCAGGEQTATRTVSSTHAFGGVVCPTDLTKSQNCNTQACPVNCALSEWTEYDTCTRTCGTGSETRTRTVSVYPDHGGAQCGNLEESRSCAEEICPQDCVMTEFSSWSDCSATCGTGYQDRNRDITTQAGYGGVACSETQEVRQCNTEECAIDCVVSDWSSLSDCDVTCGGGTQTRTRSISVEAVFGGVACPELYSDQACNDNACPVDCVVSDFSSWSECGKTCSAGEQSRTREITTETEHGGVACPELSETQGCNDGPCPIHCEVSDFTDWSECSKTCGSGFQTRSRDIVTQDNHGGNVCPFLDESQTCSDQNCPTDCVLAEYTEWSTCTTTCGTGQKTRTRTIDTDVADGGVACGVLHEEAECNTESCPIDCIVTDFTPFSECSHSCGTGIESRERSITRDVAFGGVACPALIESQNCNAEACPIDCVVPAWTADDWSDCSSTCGGGSRTRTRVATQDADHGGQACASLTASESCNGQACPVDCVSVEGNWGECSATCGTGSRTNTHTITTQAAYGGAECAATEVTEECNLMSCEVDCAVGEYGEWSECSQSCDGGMEIRTRPVTQLASGGGADCPQLAESRPCNEAACHEQCSHVYCQIVEKPGRTNANGSPERLVRVMHDKNEQHGQTHACKIINNQCKCLCFDTAESFMAKALAHHFSDSFKKSLGNRMSTHSSGSR
jgi:hypothetical protein